MFLMLQVASVFLAAVVMTQSLAHTLEFPGKLRLDKEAYLAVQSIYYPGFTIGGASEPLGILATLALLTMTEPGTTAFAWTLVGFIALVAVHAVYWTVTHPVNKFWIKDQDLHGMGAGFFDFGKRDVTSGEDPDALWEMLRDRWEYSHVVRSGLAVVALVALTIAVALD